LGGLRIHAIDYEGASPPVELSFIKDIYSKFRGMSEDLIEAVAAEMAKTISPVESEQCRFY
jgi:hypothetical protein